MYRGRHPKSIKSCARNSYLASALKPADTLWREMRSCKSWGDSGVVVLPGGDVAQDVDVVKACGGHCGCGPSPRPAALKLRRGRLARYGVTASVFYGAAPHKKNQLGSPKGLPSLRFFSEKTEAGDKEDRSKSARVSTFLSFCYYLQIDIYFPVLIMIIL